MQADLPVFAVMRWQQVSFWMGTIPVFAVPLKDRKSIKPTRKTDMNFIITNNGDRGIGCMGFVKYIK